jgi:hypothetical protein
MAVTLSLQLTVVAANPAPLARYMFAPMVLGILTLPLIAANPRFGRRSGADSQASGPSHKSEDSSSTDRDTQPAPVA